MSTNQTINASADVMSGFASMTDLVGPLVLLMFGALIVGIAANYERFEWLADQLAILAKSVGYAVYGLVTLIVIAAISAPLYLLSRMDAQTQTQLGKWVGIAILVYVGLVVLGMASKPIWQRLATYAKRYHEENIAKPDTGENA